MTVDSERLAVSAVNQLSLVMHTAKNDADRIAAAQALLAFSAARLNQKQLEELSEHVVGRLLGRRK